jgi:glycosyltransferase involved in cell wall biosynthesis
MLLPPGSPEPVEVPRGPDARDLLFVGHMRYPVHGLDLLVGAVERVREAGHEVGVICVSRPGEEPPEPRPTWMRVERGGPDEIRRLLPGVVATIQPRHRSPYNDLAVPVKVLESLAYGRPLIVTDCIEQAAIVRGADAGVVAAATPESLGDAIVQVLEAPASQAERWSANATAAARANSWATRARSIVETLESLS